MTLEKLAKQIFDECQADDEPVSMEEALEMAKMELGAKTIKNYVKAEEPKPETEKKKRVSKVSDAKKDLFNVILDSLVDVFGENAEVLKENKLISVKIDEKIFKIDVIETRKKL